jgi:hypothetical protein
MEVEGMSKEDEERFHATHGLYEACWHCHGAGGWHDCGDDCCPCLEPEITDECPECDGEGWLPLPAGRMGWEQP